MNSYRMLKIKVVDPDLFRFRSFWADISLVRTFLHNKFNNKKKFEIPKFSLGGWIVGPVEDIQV